MNIEAILQNANSQLQIVRTAIESKQAPANKKKFEAVKSSFIDAQKTSKILNERAANAEGVAALVQAISGLEDNFNDYVRQYQNHPNLRNDQVITKKQKTFKLSNPTTLEQALKVIETAGLNQKQRAHIALAAAHQKLEGDHAKTRKTLKDFPTRDRINKAIKTAQQTAFGFIADLLVDGSIQLNDIDALIAGNPGYKRGALNFLPGQEKNAIKNGRGLYEHIINKQNPKPVPPEKPTVVRQPTQLTPLQQAFITVAGAEYTLNQRLALLIHFADAAEIARGNLIPFIGIKPRTMRTRAQLLTNDLIVGIPENIAQAYATILTHLPDLNRLGVDMRAYIIGSVPDTTGHKLASIQTNIPETTFRQGRTDSAAAQFARLARIPSKEEPEASTSGGPIATTLAPALGR